MSEMVNVIDAIMSRRSVRDYTDQAISDEAVKIILKAGMSGPSCTNARDWAFIVVKDRDMLNRMADKNGDPAEPLRTAAMGILVCGDLERAFPGAKDYWIVDAAIAGQNMILAARGLGIGSVWLGTWPQMERVNAQAELFGLPETVIPHSILSFGYPTRAFEDMSCPFYGYYEGKRVHYDRW